MAERMISAAKLVTVLARKFRNKGVLHYDDLMAVIADVPSVDAVEVVHGRWQERRFICMDSEVMLGYRCSRCMLTFDAETNYCPNCGAKMDGGNEDGC